MKNDLTGLKFGKITVISYNGVKEYKCGTKDNLWKCRCECGNEIVLCQTYIKSGKASCGCVRREKARKQMTKHGCHDSKLYNVWNSIKSRCLNPNVKCYERYGGRGITICDEWKNFSKFMEWACENGYKENADLSIDRIDNNGNYEPSNCRWVDRYTQANNKRNNHKIIYQGELLSLNQIERITNVDHRYICQKLKNGWDINRIINSSPSIGTNQYGTKPTTEEFIARAREIHSDKYDYSKVEYINCDTKVCIICPEHGEFWQTPYNHINRKHGCPICSRKNRHHSN